jgi:hypothetical protein
MCLNAAEPKQPPAVSHNARPAGDDVVRRGARSDDFAILMSPTFARLQRRMQIDQKDRRRDENPPRRRRAGIDGMRRR